MELSEREKNMIVHGLRLVRKAQLESNMRPSEKAMSVMALDELIKKVEDES